MSTRKPKTEKAEEKTPVAKKVSYVHIDEFIRQKGNQLSKDIINGFRIFMKGKSYQHSIEDFEKELQNFFKRKI